MILYLNCDDNDITFNKKNYLLRAAKRLGIDWVRDIKDKTEGECQEYVLNIEPYHYVKGYVWTGLWEIDLLLSRHEYDPDTWKLVDDIFLAIDMIPPKCKQYADRTSLLYQACDVDIHKPMPDIKKEFDFIHCGTRAMDVWCERDRLIRLLQDNKYTFKDFNKGHKPVEYVKNINTAKVQFIRSMGNNYEAGETAQRFFECLAIGPVLTNYCIDLEHLGLIEGGDYLSYKTDEELLAKMKKLIDNPEYASHVAESGRKKALMYHTYEHRLMSIINKIKDHENRIDRP